jgi:DHA3 family multidrug efflux protein-like MFS transporter
MRVMRIRRFEQPDWFPGIETHYSPRNGLAVYDHYRGHVSGAPSTSSVKTFHRLVANTLVASVTNNFVWFALTFWVYLETRSVIASSVIGGGYMLLLAVTGLLFGTFVDRHERKVSMLVANAGSLAAYLMAAGVYVIAPQGSLQDLSHPAFWGFVILVLAGAIAGNLRSVALSTTVTLLVPEDRRDKANGLVGTVNGVSFAVTSVFSGLAIGLLGMGWSVGIAIVLTVVAAAHLLSIRIDEDRPEPDADQPTGFDVKGAVRAVRVVPGLLALLFLSTFNNLLGGVFMALLDPYGLTLVSVEAWGLLVGLMSVGFILGGIAVARWGLGDNPVRALLVTNVVLWSVSILFPVRSSIVLLSIGFFLFTAMVPRAEAAEQTIIQRLVPFAEQGRVFGFAQSLETAASPVTSFLIGPLAQLWVIPSMTDGAGADTIGSWFGTGPDRGMALIFIVAGIIGLAATVLALRSRPYHRLSATYADAGDDSRPAAPAELSGTTRSDSR